MAKIPLKGAPWLLVIQAAMSARDRWGVLTAAERADLTRLLRVTKGRPGNLTALEKRELRRLVGKLDLPGLGRDLLPLGRKRGSRR